MVKPFRPKQMSDLEDAYASAWMNSEVARQPLRHRTLSQDELPCDLEDYGTAASQRPQRERKRPARFAESLKPVKKLKVQQQPAQKSRQTRSVKRSTVKRQPTLRRKKSSTSQLGPGQLGSPITSTAVEAAKRSLIVRLRFRSSSIPQVKSYPSSEDVCGQTDIKYMGHIQSEELRGQNFGSHTCLHTQPDSLVSPQPDFTSSPILNLEMSPDADSYSGFTLSQSHLNESSSPQTPDQSPNTSSRNSHFINTVSQNHTPSRGAEKIYDPPTPDSLPRSMIDNKCSASFALSMTQTQLAGHTQTIMSENLSRNNIVPKMIIPQDAGSVATSDYEDALQTVVEDPHSALLDDRLRVSYEKLFAHRGLDRLKPAPIGSPAVWAEGRQELCETLHYYRAYQGACYSTGGFVRGFMFDKVAHPRDYTDSNVVVSRAGGSLIKDKDSGEMRVGRDQVEDSVAQGLRNCQGHHNPVVIITGIDNPTMPSKPPHQYCVLDFFKPTHIWVEKSGESKIVRYRFEKLNSKKDSWWRPKNLPDPVELGSLPPPMIRNCIACRKDSFQVYLNGWMCLYPDCPRFWKMKTRQLRSDSLVLFFEPEEASLIYDPRFLKQKTVWPNDDHEYTLGSNNAQLSGYSIPGEDTSQAFWLGMVCPKCGRCNSRLGWMGWECANPTCDFKKQPPHIPIPASSLREPLWPLTDSYTLSRDIRSSLINVQVSFLHGYRINRYGIPGINGFITHMIANKAVIEEPGGPDTMFEELQQRDIGLRRHPMPNAQLKGPNHCRHFTVNYGMPYKFIAATASRSFSGAVSPITSGRSRLNWAAKLLLAQETKQTMGGMSKEWKEKEFNEVLALGYFEAQKINYHDDGEHGLGPTIATLSLGAPGSMRLRMKARHYHGVSNAGVYDDAPPLPGCQQYEARLALQSSLETLKQSDTKAYAAKRKQIPKDLKLRSGGQAKDVLNMQLGHGDIVVMHGVELQRYYEHAVEHGGKLRFALTCRYIDPRSLKEEDQPGYEVEPDEGAYDGAGVMGGLG